MHQPKHTGRLISIQVAQPKTIGDGEEGWTTSFFKQPVDAPVVLGRTSLVGDRQADTKHHGGLDKAVLAYSTDHTEFWQQELSPDIPPGGFGENLSISGITETSTCIGDHWRIGEAELEVSQPRQPCWKLGRRWNRNDLPKLVVQNGRSGWYLRVIRTGIIAAGDDIVLVSRPHPDWAVARVSNVYYRGDPQERRSLTRGSLSCRTAGEKIFLTDFGGATLRYECMRLAICCK